MQIHEEQAPSDTWNYYSIMFGRTQGIYSDTVCLLFQQEGNNPVVVEGVALEACYTPGTNTTSLDKMATFDFILNKVNDMKLVMSRGS